MPQPTGAETLPTNHKLYGLDFLRAIAITLVFLYHYGRMFPHPEWTNSISHFGWTGVDLFFVLSGYLIASQLFAKIDQGKKISLKEFFIKRFFRIIPGYLLVVSVYFLFPFVHEREALAPLWKYLSFTQNLGLDLRYHGTFSHAWSLCIEEQFYLFLPLILVALVYFKAVKKGFTLLFILFLLGFAARLYSWYTLVAPFADTDEFYICWYKWIYYPTWNRLDGLLIGVLLAGIFQFKPKLKAWIQANGHLLFAMSMAILTASYFLCADQASFNASIFGFPLVAIGYGLLVASAISPAGFLYKIKSPGIISIATFSYSIYLTHKIVIHLTQEQFSKLPVSKEGNLMFVICISTSILVAFAMHRLIEKPCASLRNKLLSSLYSGRKESAIL